MCEWFVVVMGGCAVELCGQRGAYVREGDGKMWLCVCACVCV